MIEHKVRNIANKLMLDQNNKYLKEALFVAKYEKRPQQGFANNLQMTESATPNKVLAIIGDRYLKLILSIEGFKKSDSAKFINDFTVERENNIYLAKLNIIQPTDGYAEKNGVFTDNLKSDSISIATIVEAIIGALFLEEYERRGTSKAAFNFIEKYILKQL